VIKTAEANLTSNDRPDDLSEKDSPNLTEKTSPGSEDPLYVPFPRPEDQVHKNASSQKKMKITVDYPEHSDSSTDHPNSHSRENFQKLRTSSP
jgi:hypothetical protein